MIRSNWRVYNLTLTNANTEYSQALTDVAAFVAIQSRNPGVDLQFTFTSGETGTLYKTIYGGSQWESLGPIHGDKTVYFRCGTAGVVVEIEEWT